jgi:hypothetical protein
VRVFTEFSKCKQQNDPKFSQCEKFSHRFRSRRYSEELLEGGNVPLAKSKKASPVNGTTAAVFRLMSDS